MQIVATDLVGPLPESDNRNKYILVVSDYFTCLVEAFPLPNQEANTVATKLVDEVFYNLVSQKNFILTRVGNSKYK